MRLEINGVGHAYGELEVLSDISIAIESGEVIALVGPSGCGKSTLLSIAGGLLAPTTGEVLQQGTLPQGCLNPLTYVFQDFSLLPWRTVEGNVQLALEHHPLSTAQHTDRTDRVLRMMGLSDFRTAYPKQLSGGMRQRVAIARALAVNPAVLLMDEPLSALDAQTRTLLLEEFTNLFDALGATVIYVTHNLREAVQLADRVVVLSRRPGRIKDCVRIDLPRSRRNSDDPIFRKHVDRLWTLIRDEVIDADRELADAP